MNRKTQVEKTSSVGIVLSKTNCNWNDILTFSQLGLNVGEKTINPTLVRGVMGLHVCTSLNCCCTFLAPTNWYLHIHAHTQTINTHMYTKNNNNRHIRNSTSIDCFKNMNHPNCTLTQWRGTWWHRIVLPSTVPTIRPPLGNHWGCTQHDNKPH